MILFTESAAPGQKLATGRIALASPLYYLNAVFGPTPLGKLPRRVFTGAIHVYGGDFFSEPRSEWESESAEEAPYSVEHAMQAFAEANERWLSLQENGS